MRLGQIAAYQGRHAKAYEILRGVLLDEDSYHKSNRVLRMITTWYDAGTLWWNHGWYNGG